MGSNPTPSATQLLQAFAPTSECRHDRQMIRLLIGFLSLWLCCSAVAAGFGAPVVERIDPARLGGAHPMGFAAHEDADGVLHLANVDGLVRVSGSRARIHPLGSTGLVRALLPDGDRLHVGGYDAYGEFRRNAAGVPELVDLSVGRQGEPLGTVWRIIAWRGSILVVTGGRLIVRTGSDTREIPTPARTTAAFVHDDRVYLRAEGVGLIRLDETGTGFATVPGTALLGESALRAALPWNGAVLLATERHGLQSFDGERLTPWPARPLLPVQREQPYALHRLSDGRLLVGTLAGSLHLIDADGRWLQSHELASAPILGISESREGGLLVSTERGLYRVYWPGAWERIGAEHGVEGAVRGLLRHAGATWLATSTGLYRRADSAPATAGFEQLTPEIIDFRALALVGGVPVLASDLGLHVWQNGKLGPALDLLGSCYGVLPSDQHPGRFYSACDDGLLVVERVGAALRVLGEARGTLARISALDEVADDALLVTLLEGLPRQVRLAADGGILGDESAAAGLPADQPALVLYRAGPDASDRHRLLAAGRVWAWTGNAWKPHSEPWPVVLGDGLDSLVLHDRGGNELMLGRHGLAVRPIGSREWRRVSLPGGDGAQVTSGALEDALYLWDHERIWRAPLGAEGFLGLFAELVQTRVHVDRLQIESGGQRRDLALPPARLPGLSIGTQLTVDVSLPTLALPAEFRSRLGSVQRPGEFGSWTTDATRVLPVLPQGQFRLEIEARNALGVSAEPVVLNFEVVAPWWHSRMWLMLGGIALLALGTSGALALRSRLLKRRNRQLEALVRERTEALSAANRQLTLQANSDGLTGLLNRRRFDVDWPQALADAAHHGRPVALLLIDLDHFKRYNDRHGHLMGDERLRACADWLAQHAEATTGATVYRYGGEEFATILCQSEPGPAEAYAVELCEGAERRFGADGTTLSVGLRCDVPGPADDALAWLAAVDAALYSAKHAGRNRVRVQRGEGPAGTVSAPAGH